MNTKSRFDFQSIKVRLWIYFIGFAVIILVLIWLLQIFFLDTYYEEMKRQESQRTADQVVALFKSADHIEDEAGLDAFNETIQELTRDTDSYILIQSDAQEFTLSKGYPFSQTAAYLDEAAEMRIQLLNGKEDVITYVTQDANSDTQTLCYARYLYRPEEISKTLKSGAILYMFTPLYPVQSTVSILRIQLMYVTIIAVLLALSLSLYLTNRISKPIKELTAAAEEMGKGNYGVQFRGGPFSEITDLASTLTDASRELEKTDMYQKDLIANVSHDLKTPLTMIKSYAEMIRDLSGDNPAKRQEHLGVIMDEADRLNALVNDMLNLSRMQSRSIELSMDRFDLRAAAMSLMPSYDILADQEGYKFRVQIAKTPLWVNGDEGKIKQVLSNLISNAVKYCGEDKEILISLKKSGRKVRCEVRDHGAGIAPDELSHVWERYYKSSTHHVRSTEGTGLGLSIVREILVLHKAEYGVLSKVGKGSVFWFEMDLAKPPEEKKEKRKK